MIPKTRPKPTWVHLVRCVLPLLLFLPVAGLTQEMADDACLDCHDGLAQTLDQTSHQLSSTIVGSAHQIACVDCHQGGAVHIEDPSVDNIGNPSALSGSAGLKVCISCHQPHQNLETLGLDPHFAQDLACTSCHEVHSAGSNLLLDDDGQFCGQCHIGVANEFERRSSHPLADGTVSCMSCHNFSAQNEPTIGHGASSNCLSCHQDQSGPYLWEHEPTSSFSTEGEGCVACHAPHGSIFDRLLTQPGDRLCQQCHGESTAHTATAHEGQYAGNNCMDCHQEVHGSFGPSNHFLLDPDLGSKLGGTHATCYCHSRNQ